MSKPKPTPAFPKLLFLLLSLALLGTAVAFFARPYLRTAQATGETVVRISMSGWQPGVIYTKAGVPMTLTVVNLDNAFHTDGGGWHNFVVEALGVAERVAPSQTRSFTFTPGQPGEYIFYCDICCGGKDNPFMQGKLVVS